MFNPESIWGNVLRFARNRKEPEATMLKACSDINCVNQTLGSLSRLQLAVDPAFTTPLCEPDDWAAEDSVLDLAKAAYPEYCIPNPPVVSYMLTFLQLDKLHDMYMRMWGPTSRYCQLYDRFLCHLATKSATQLPHGTSVNRSTRQVQFNNPAAKRVALNVFANWRPTAAEEQLSEADIALIAVNRSDIQLYRTAKIGPLLIRLGSWFLARPSMLTDLERVNKLMWFGLVERIFTHARPEGTVLFVQVSDHLLVCPLNPNSAPHEPQQCAP